MDSLYLSERILVSTDEGSSLISGGIVVSFTDGTVKRIFTSQQEINSWLFLVCGGDVRGSKKKRGNFFRNVFVFLLQVHDYGNKIIMPGLIDANVNVSCDEADDFSSITKSAAAGGFTTIVDNPM